MLLRAAVGTTMNCVLAVKNKMYPNWCMYWLKVLILCACWGHPRWLKAEMFKEVIKWLPLKDLSKKKSMLKIEHLSIFKMVIYNGMHTMVVNLPKSYTIYYAMGPWVYICWPSYRRPSNPFESILGLIFSRISPLH
jgi:hypothetical protein